MSLFCFQQRRIGGTHFEKRKRKTTSVSFLSFFSFDAFLFQRSMIDYEILSGLPATIALAAPGAFEAEMKRVC